MLRLPTPRYEPAYGARPVRRAVRQYVLNPLAQELLGFQDGLEGARVVVDALDGQVRIRVLGKDAPRELVEAGLAKPVEAGRVHVVVVRTHHRGARTRTQAAV